MDDGSPVALNYRYHFDNGQQATSMNHPNNMGGLAIAPSQSDQILLQESSNAAHSTPSRHQHNPSIVSIDSVFEQAGAQQPTPNASKQRGQSNVSESKPVNGLDLIDKDQEPPAWSEMKTKAGKERKRLPLACIACRRKKIKCSGEKPACRHCLKARVPCVYKVTTRKPEKRTDYLAMLDKRLKRMEDRVIRIIPKEDLPDFNSTGRSSVRPPIPGTFKHEKNVANTKRSAEEAFTDELQDWTKARNWGTQLDAAARVRTQKDTENKLFTEGADALPPQHVQEHLAEVFFDCLYGQSYLLLHKPSFMRKLKASSIPPVLILAVCAISARFSTHPQVSTEPAFLRGEQWATPARAIVEKRHFEPNITILTCMIILGLHYFGTCEGGLSWSFGGQAMRMGYALQLHRELDHDPLGQAQAERAAASGKPVPHIQELSFTDREIRRRTMWACYLMDSFNSSGTERPSFLSEEYMSIQLPIKESHFQMEIPGQTEDLDGHVPLSKSRSSLADQSDLQAEAKSNMGVGAYIVRAVVVWKRIVKYLNLGGKDKDPYSIWDDRSQFASLQRQIVQLKASLPTSLIYNKDNLATHATERLANQFLCLHVIIAQTSLFLHRFAIPTAPNTHRPYPPNTPKSFLATAATTVLDAALQISTFLADSTGHTLTVPFAGYCAYASATVHVWGIFSRNPMLEQTSRENLRHNYRYLNRMKRYWGMFHYMAESIKDIYRTFADASARSAKRRQNQSLAAAVDSSNPVESAAISAQPSRAGSPSEANDLGEDKQKGSEGSKGKVFQYGDWFNKYPHGVSEQEWEERHLPHRSELQKGTEAVMSQQAELQSVEEFFASLSPPSKADDSSSISMRGKKIPRKRGKSIVEERVGNKFKEAGVVDPSRKQSTSSQKQSQHPGTASISSTNLQGMTQQPLSQQDFSTPELDVPMSGISTGLQSGQGNSAFDLTSPTVMFSAGPNDAGNPFASISGPTSNPKHGSQHAQFPQAQSPYDYTSPSTSSNPGTNNNFTYTSALPQLDRQMVFGGYAGIDPNTSGSSNALNNINNLDFWNNPWDTSIDIDGFSGFNDPSVGVISGVMAGHSPGEARKRSWAPSQSQQGNNNNNNNNINGSNDNSNSTAWFMPFNIEPPNSTNCGSGGSNAGFDEFMGLDSMMEMGGFTFSPGMGE
ncbi:hypothetical protein H2198_000483 [Neophaeococcomyces mojaviensis]|uniref:Uncharacterized protein n=1 Tax=Neophaeococcomyces mojaviensis TaxID=3383035 RepID=A0ACC3AJS9_9EURO|nr:hypothetical protein H2198_000483 [Knufia sp. JES_112]